jgi:hypothetical protein
VGDDIRRAARIRSVVEDRIAEEDDVGPVLCHRRISCSLHAWQIQGGRLRRFGSQGYAAGDTAAAPVRKYNAREEQAGSRLRLRHSEGGPPPAVAHAGSSLGHDPDVARPAFCSLARGT